MNLFELITLFKYVGERHYLGKLLHLLHACYMATQKHFNNSNIQIFWQSNAKQQSISGKHAVWLQCPIEPFLKPVFI